MGAVYTAFFRRPDPQTFGTVFATDRLIWSGCLRGRVWPAWDEALTLQDESSELYLNRQNTDRAWLCSPGGLVIHGSLRSQLPDSPHIRCVRLRLAGCYNLSPLDGQMAVDKLWRAAEAWGRRNLDRRAQRGGYDNWLLPYIASQFACDRPDEQYYIVYSKTAKEIGAEEDPCRFAWGTGKGGMFENGHLDMSLSRATEAGLVRGYIASEAVWRVIGPKLDPTHHCQAPVTVTPL